jgi:hypothetical protein
MKQGNFQTEILEIIEAAEIQRLCYVQEFGIGLG